MPPDIKRRLPGGKRGVRPVSSAGMHGVCSVLSGAIDDLSLFCLEACKAFSALTGDMHGVSMFCLETSTHSIFPSR